MASQFHLPALTKQRTIWSLWIFLWAPWPVWSPMWGMNSQPCGQDLTWHQELDMSLTEPPRPWSLQILCVKMLDWGQKTLLPSPPPEQSGEFEGQNQTASHIKSGSLLLSCTAIFNELCPWSPRGVSSETEASILLLGCHLILQLTCSSFLWQPSFTWCPSSPHPKSSIWEG